MELSKDVQERINADAETYAGTQVWVNKSPDDTPEHLFHEYISSNSYIAGATAENSRAQQENEQLKARCDKMATLLYMLQSVHSHQWSEGNQENVRQTLQQWQQWKEGKEPVKEEPKSALPDLGICKKCQSRPATTDYNGHGYYVCQPCDDSLNREFDEEYR